MRNAPHPLRLTWPEVAPGLHPFDPATALATLASLPPARDIPARPAEYDALSDWARGPGARWADALTRALAAHYGSWSIGWRWAPDEGDFGGGPVGSWCCLKHSLHPANEPLATVAAALCEWRAWLEDLAERFDRYALDAVPAGERLHVWESAAVHLVNHVVDRTGGGDAWYGHCEQVLGWYLARWDIPPELTAPLIKDAIGGRFRSWATPEPVVVSDVAERLALSLDDAVD